MIKELVVDDEFIQEMEQYRVPTDEERQQGIIYAGSKNVIVFAEKMLGLKPPGMIMPKGSKRNDGRLYSWQVYVLKDIQEAILSRKEQYIKIESVGGEHDGHLRIIIDKTEFIVVTSRQIGKSTFLALLSLWIGTYNHAPAGSGNCSSIIIVSAGDTQAKKLLNEVNKMIRLGDAKMAEYGYDDFFSNLLDPNEANNKQQISFLPHKEKHGDLLLVGSKLGSTIKSYPPTSIVLGETASIVIEDEAGRTDKITDEFHKEYLYPTGNSTHAIRMYTSTPWVTSGFFYKLCDPDDEYEHKDTEITYCFTIDAVKTENPSYHEDIMEEIQREISNGNMDYVQRAYYCRFVKGERNYFDPEDVTKSFVDYAMYESYKGECDMGIDFGGQTTSRSVITISKLGDDNKVMRLFHKVYEVGQDNTIIEDVEELLTRFNVQRIIPDECPQGDYLIRQMKEKGWNVEPMNFTTWKVKKYGAFRAMLHNENIVSYQDDELKTEMRAMEQHQGARNTIIKHAPNYNDDMIDSFVMSCFFFVAEENNFKMYSYDGLDDIEEVTNGCQACGSNKIVNNTCKDCGFIQRD